MIGKLQLLGEDDFRPFMDNTIRPWIQETMEEGYLAAADGLKLHYCCLPNPQEIGRIMIMHGYCEFFGKYHELSWYLWQQGYGIYFLEQRGHGYSDRDGVENDMVYVSDFNEYVAGFYYMGMLGVVLLHAVQTDHYDLQPLLRKKVMAGIFPADKYMEFEAWWEDVHPGKEHHYGSGLNNIYYIGNTLFVEQPDNLKQIDKNREKLGLAETWQDAVKKRVWECEHNTSFITGSRQSRIFGDEEDDAAEVARLKQEIDAEHAAGDFHRMYYEKGSKVSE